MGYISIDSSTSSTTVVIFDEYLKIKKKFQKEHKQIHTIEGYVEHDLNEIYENLIELISKAALLDPEPKFISLTNQRETFTLFNKETGRPERNAVVWQCTRGQKICNEILQNKKISIEIQKKTGLKANTFFSASKLKWIFENDVNIKKKFNNGEILFGTIDTYLIYRLTSCREYTTDTTNASRTLLFNSITNQWDKDLFKIFEINDVVFPKIKSSSDFFGESDFEKSFSKKIPIMGVVGDAQGSFFANNCFKIGDTKITTGTGFNIQTNIGDDFSISDNAFTSLAYTHNSENYYSLECLSSFAGATISWLKNNLQLIESPDESESISSNVNHTGGVYLIPAFTGLGPPYWTSSDRAAFLGINASTNKHHMVRAALESVVFQMIVYIESIQKDYDFSLQDLVVDGGMIKNKLFLQLISSLLNIEIKIPQLEEMSLYGALLLGVQKTQKIDNLRELCKYSVNFDVIHPRSNDIIRNSFEEWKTLIDKHFMKNQA